MIPLIPSPGRPKTTSTPPVRDGIDEDLGCCRCHGGTSLSSFTTEGVARRAAFGRGACAATDPELWRGCSAPNFHGTTLAAEARERLETTMRLLTAALVLAVSAPGWAEDHSVTSGALVQYADRYYGDHVQVTGEIARVLDRRAITLDEDRPFAHHDLLVLVPRPLTRLNEGTDVIVSGYVRRLDVRELRRDYEWFDEAVPEDVLDETDRRPVLVADTIVFGSERRRSARARDEDREPRDRRRARDDREGRVAKRRSRLVVRDDEEADGRLAVGSNVLLSDARVLQVLGRTTFTVRDDGGHELVVRVDRQSMLPVEGERLDISGVVRRVPTAIDTWDLESEGARRLVRSKGTFVEARRVASAR
jgi:hypothetical protein